MLADLQSYYFASMNTVRKNLPSVAILISLQIKGTAKKWCPTPFYPFEKITYGSCRKAKYIKLIFAHANYINAHIQILLQSFL